MLSNRKAQAVLELAILGSLMIMAFSILINYSEQYNREQSYMQQTFRSALMKAKEINNTASWTTTDFRRMPNVTNPMEIGALQQFGSSNSVLWSDGKPKVKGSGKIPSTPTVPKAYFQLNRDGWQEIPPQEGAGPGDITITNSNHTSNLYSVTDFTKTENHGNITTHKTFTPSDSITGSADVGGTPVSLNSTLGSGGIYHN